MYFWNLVRKETRTKMGWSRKNMSKRNEYDKFIALCLDE